MVNLWNRRGDTHWACLCVPACRAERGAGRSARRQAHQCIGFYEQTRRGLPESVRISWVLADSGFGEEAFLEHLEAQNQRYIVALRLTAYVQRAIRGIGPWQELARGLAVAEVTLALSSWKQARRLIVICQLRS